MTSLHSNQDLISSSGERLLFSFSRREIVGVDLGRFLFMFGRSVEPGRQLWAMRNTVVPLLPELETNLQPESENAQRTFLAALLERCPACGFFLSLRTPHLWDVILAVQQRITVIRYGRRIVYFVEPSSLGKTVESVVEQTLLLGSRCEVSPEELASLRSDLLEYFSRCKRSCRSLVGEPLKE